MSVTPVCLLILNPELNRLGLHTPSWQHQTEAGHSTRISAHIHRTHMSLLFPQAGVRTRMVGRRAWKDANILTS